MKILGMDLGTSNTYIFGSNGSGQPTPVAVPEISSASGSISTVILYQNDEAFLIGDIAESEYYSNIAASADRRFISQFKPEIASASSDAIRWMTDFLRMLREALPEGVLEGDSELYVGIPARGREDFALNLGRCFDQAGWPKPRFVRESDAAMISCLQSGAIDIRDIEHNTLILDFGGGTCDCTGIERMQALENSGDPLYGGRLFDDLFYQVFCHRDARFANGAPESPFAYYLHWIVCKSEKERFSDYVNAQSPEESGQAVTLVMPWFDAAGKKMTASISLDRNDFVSAAENYLASPQMLSILGDYARRGGLSQEARDLLEGRSVGLISWLRRILENIGARNCVDRVILTGGSSRWFFTRDLVSELFPSASVSLSKRDYEDIAFGLALYPSLLAERDKVHALLEGQLDRFSEESARAVNEMIADHSRTMAAECAARIVSRDVMPVLEDAASHGMTIAEMEKAFRENMKNDDGLLKIVSIQSQRFEHDVKRDLEHRFAVWLKSNGVMLVPRFDFPASVPGHDFFDAIRMRLDGMAFLNIMEFMTRAVLPGMAAFATAAMIAHTGEPVSTVLGGGLAFAGVWGLGRVGRKILWKRKLPAFFLSPKNREKIAEKNRKYIQDALNKAFMEVQADFAQQTQDGIRRALTGMLAKLGILNQVSLAG